MKRRENGSEHCILRQEGASVTWPDVKYETVNRAAWLTRKHFESVDDVQGDPDVENIPNIEDDEDRLLDEPDSTPD